MPVFPATRHSIIERVRSTDEETRRQALGDVVEGYWKAVYKYLRVHWRVDHEDAQELTQAFFSEALQKEWLSDYDPAKARFRTFVRVCADRFVMNTRQASARLKRGGGLTLQSLDFPGVEEEIGRLGLTAPSDAEQFFHNEFVRALFERTLAGVREEFSAPGDRVYLQLFERYDVNPTEGVTHATLAEEFGLTPTQVTNYLAKVRRSFRTRAVDALRSLCGSAEEFRREGRELFGVDVE